VGDAVESSMEAEALAPKGFTPIKPPAPNLWNWDGELHYPPQSPRHLSEA